jgi:predicted nucleic acid-binding protein
VLRVVLDANVFVSAYLNPEGTPGQIVQSFLRDGSFELGLAEPIIAEVLEALAYPRMLKAARSEIEPALWFEDLVVLSQLVADDIAVPRLSGDPEDDHTTHRSSTRRRIVTPRSFLEIIDDR